MNNNHGGDVRQAFSPSTLAITVLLLVNLCPGTASASSGVEKVFMLGDQPAVRLADGSTFQLGRPGDPAIAHEFMKQAGADGGIGSRSIDPIITPPPQVDLRSFQTDIKAQTGDTCSVFAVTAAIEAAYKRKYTLTLDLSERYLNHVQKAHWLNFEARLPAREIQPETNSGGNLQWHALVLTRYGLPQERTLSFVPTWQYRSDLDDPNVQQRVLDDYNLGPDVFPQAALADARFGPSEVRLASGADRSNLQWFKTQLALKREVAFMMKCCPTSDPTPDNGIWDPPTDFPVTAPHAMLMVGYSDQDRAFLVKNSWGRKPNGEGQPGHDLDKDGFIKLSYDWVTRGLIYDALSIVDVTDPNRSNGSRENAQLFLGRWNLVHDGWPGILDLYRLPRNATRPSDEDIRVGTYWGPDGVARRVNAVITQNRIDFCIDWHNPDQSGRVQPFTPMGTLTSCQSGTGLQFTGFLFTADPGFIAGTLVDHRDQHTYPFYATKYARLSGVAANGFQGGNSYLGKWIVNRDGAIAELTFATFNPKSGEIIGTYKPDTTLATPSIPVKGFVDQATSRLSLDIRFPTTPPLSFSGYLLSKERGLMSGQLQWGGLASGFVARRTGGSVRMLDAVPLR